MIIFLEMLTPASSETNKTEEFTAQCRQATLSIKCFPKQRRLSRYQLRRTGSAPRPKINTQRFMDAFKNRVIFNYDLAINTFFLYLF